MKKAEDIVIQTDEAGGFLLVKENEHVDHRRMGQGRCSAVMAHVLEILRDEIVELKLTRQRSESEDPAKKR